MNLMDWLYRILGECFFKGHDMKFFAEGATVIHYKCSRCGKMTMEIIGQVNFS